MNGSQKYNVTILPVDFYKYTDPDEYFALILLITCQTTILWGRKLHSRQFTNPGSITLIIHPDLCVPIEMKHVIQFYAPGPVYFNSLNQLVIDVYVRENMRRHSGIIIIDESAEAAFVTLYFQMKERIGRNQRRGTAIFYEFGDANAHNDSSFVENMFDQFGSLQTTGHIFVMMCTLEHIKKVLNEAHHRHLLKAPTQWLILANDDTKYIRSEMAELVRRNITNIIIMYLETENCKEEFSKYREQIFSCVYQWFLNVFDNRQSSSFTSKLMEKRNLIASIRKFSCPVECLFNTTSFLVGSSDKAIPNDLTWTLGQGFSSNKQLLRYKKSKGLEDIEIKVFTIYDPPWQTLGENCSQSLKDYDGVSFRLFKELHNRLQFRYTISCERTNNTTAFWDIGLLKLQNQEADFLVIASIITEERKENVTFTSPFHREPYTILSAAPKEKSRIYLLFEPFGMHVWLGLLGVLLLMSSSLYILQVTILKLENKQHSKTVAQTSGFFECHFLMYGILVQQGVSLSPTNLSVRILVTVWLLAMIITTAMYGGNLVASLTIPRLTPQIRNIAELLNDKEGVTWGISEKSTVLLRLMNTDDEKLTFIRDNAIIHPDLTNEVLKKVQTEKHVVIEAKTNILFRLQAEYNVSWRQQFVLGDDLYFDRVAFAMKKDFPFHPVIDKEYVTE